MAAPINSLSIEEASFDWSRLLHTIQATITNPTNKCGRCAVTQTSTQQHVIIIEGIQIFRNKYNVIKCHVFVYIIMCVFGVGISWRDQTYHILFKLTEKNAWKGEGTII